MVKTVMARRKPKVLIRRADGILVGSSAQDQATGFRTCDKRLQSSSTDR